MSWSLYWWRRLASAQRGSFGIATGRSPSLIFACRPRVPCMTVASRRLPVGCGRVKQSKWGPLWAALVGCGGGVMLLLLGGSSVAFCRPFDTPDYLIPYYLRDVRSRFKHYASVQKKRGGPLYMTPEDFVLALLASPEKELKDPSIVNDLRQLFEDMDSNNDGYISFPEFCFLMALLTAKTEDLKLLCKLVDTDHAGCITRAQFAEVLRGVTQDEALVRSLERPSRQHNGFVTKLFGSEDNPHPCAYEQLHGMLQAIKVAVWTAEFKQYDTDHNGYVDARDFCQLLANQLLGTHMPTYLVNNVRKLYGSAQMISLRMWIDFHELMQKGEGLSEALELYSASGLPMTPQVFQRAVQAVGMPPLPDGTMNLIFAVFDRDGSGTVEMDEFLYIMKQKMNYHYRARAREKRSLPSRLAECSSAAVREFF